MTKEQKENVIVGGVVCSWAVELAFCLWFQISNRFEWSVNNIGALFIVFVFLASLSAVAGSVLMQVMNGKDPFMPRGQHGWPDSRRIEISISDDAKKITKEWLD